MKTTNLAVLIPIAVIVQAAVALAEDEGPQLEIIKSAEEVTSDFQNRDVQYNRTRPLGPDQSDCSDFVRQVQNNAGNEVGNVSTRELPSSAEYRRVDPDDADLGDVILKPSPDGERSGHMGIYSGDDEQGRSWGYQMGEHGAKDAPAFGSNPEFYRYNTTEDLLEQVQEQLETLLPDAATGDQSSDDVE